MRHRLWQARTLWWRFWKNQYEDVGSGHLKRPNPVKRFYWVTRLWIKFGMGRDVVS